MKTNTKVRTMPQFTHEKARASNVGAEAQLRRSIMSTLLWEDQYYEDGQEISARISSLIPKVKAERVAALAIEAREDMKLRHTPLFIVREMLRYESHRPLVRRTLSRVVQRADEMAEFMAIYWKEGRCKIANQVKRGLADAFGKFDAYQLAKYNRDATIKMRDVMFLTHPKPSEDRVGLYKGVADNTLESPDTWEVALSGGANKKATFERLMAEGNLGGMAFLRNLRNMQQAGINKRVVADYMQKANFRRVLPFRFIAAARVVPQWEDIIEIGMFRAAAEIEKLPGRTCLVVDNSGSMYGPKVSAKSDIDRSDAACALAVIVREVCENATIISFSTHPVIVPPRRGFALVDAIKRATEHGSTYTDSALALAEKEGYDRIIVITDEQSHQKVRDPKTDLAYFINVASYKNGIGYGKWCHIDGFSESVLTFIAKYEAAGF